jgi:murein DD-endopeptidase MepM/ murein hydrolase activator NlpD
MAGGSVPGNLARLFVAAGRANRIPPSVLAGVASVESNFGANKGPSSAGAIGTMQFMPGTARGLGINPMDDRQAVYGAAKLLNQYGFQRDPTRALAAYNAGPGNYRAGLGYAQQVKSEASRVGSQLGGTGVNQLGGGGLAAMPPSTTKTTLSQTLPLTRFDQAGYNQAQRQFRVGQFLRASASSPWDIGPKSNAPDPNAALRALLPSQAPNPADYTTTQNVRQSTTVLQQHATGNLQQLAGEPLVNAHPDARGYVNPIPGAVIGRTDMGVDANLKVGAPIRAIGDSRVVGISPNWYKGQPYVLLQLLSGPQRGKFYYVAEQIAPTVRPGQTVRAGQTIGTYAQSGTGLELGWGSPTPGRTLAQATTGYSEGQQTRAGGSFRSFLGSL